MKNTILTILILTCSLYSCALDSNKEELLPDLVRAEALMYSHPDSALTILETMPEPAGKINAYDFKLKNLKCKAKDAVHIQAHVTEMLKARATDAGGIKYKGFPRTNIQTKGAGQIKRIK